MYEKWLSILLVFMMMFTLTACGGGGEANQQEANNNEAVEQQQEEQQQEVELSPWLKTKTGQFYSQFKDGKTYMKYETEYEGMAMQMISATSGDKTYSETLSDGQSTGTSLMIGEDMYAIDHGSKMIVKMSLEANAQQMVDVMLDEEDVDPASVVNGTYTVDGKTYETEEWIMEDAKTILCFDGKDLAYMVGVYGEDEMILKVLEISDKVDDFLFELPEGYQMMEM